MSTVFHSFLLSVTGFAVKFAVNSIPSLVVSREALRMSFDTQECLIRLPQ